MEKLQVSPGKTFLGLPIGNSIVLYCDHAVKPLILAINIPCKTVKALGFFSLF